MDYGITEHDFWHMTFAEVERAIESKKRIMLHESQEKAAFDYIQAELIGRSVARLYSSTAKYPTLAEVYPSLFNAEEFNKKRQEERDRASAIRFKQFANAYNKNYKGVQEVSNE